MRKNLLTALTLMGLALLFRLNDIFILRLDERWGEILLSKALGFGLVILFLWLSGRRLADIGFHKHALGVSVALGLGLTVAAFIAGYGVEMLVLRASGARFQLVAIDPKAGVTGSLLFAGWLIFGNIVNSFMEEGLFRGVMGRLFLGHLSPGKANLLQAFLFGLWHLPWAVKWYQTGQIRTPGEIVFGVISNFLPQFLMGLVWGLLYLKTGNLWAAWSAHILTNTTLNLLHSVSVDGINEGMVIRMGVYTLVALSSMIVIRRVAERRNLPAAQAWDAGNIV